MRFPLTHPLYSNSNKHSCNIFIRYSYTLNYVYVDFHQTWGITTAEPINLTMYLDSNKVPYAYQFISWEGGMSCPSYSPWMTPFCTFLHTWNKIGIIINGFNLNILHSEVDSKNKKVFIHTLIDSLVVRS